ncbi:hypothetical protein C8R45DRAFT_1067811 [Mycena sanguinolenta]|nr:hypothetical protein C8R45DRAFT_1067811 [Mycena sanguinolenta]
MATESDSSARTPKHREAPRGGIRGKDEVVRDAEKEKAQRLETVASSDAEGIGSRKQTQTHAARKSHALSNDPLDRKEGIRDRRNEREHATHVLSKVLSSPCSPPLLAQSSTQVLPPMRVGGGVGRSRRMRPRKEHILRLVFALQAVQAREQSGATQRLVVRYLTLLASLPAWSSSLRAVRFVPARYPDAYHRTNITLTHRTTEGSPVVAGNFLKTEKKDPSWEHRHEGFKVLAVPSTQSSGEGSTRLRHRQAAARKIQGSSDSSRDCIAVKANTKRSFEE